MWTKYLDVAKQVAREAGQLAMTYFGHTLQVNKKGTIDLVTEADIAVEKAILKRLKSEFPHHGFLTEETNRQFKDGDFIWVVDPIDGTTNFAHGYPFFCVSIGLRHQGRDVAGVVYAPALNECFWADEGNGAWCNGNPISVSQVSELIDSMLVTGFPYDVHNDYEVVISELSRFLRQAQAIRRDGAAALDLCYIAAGRFDGFWERRLHPWDTAAAKVIVQEAGGKVTRFDGSDYSIFHKEILVSNGLVHKEMIRVLQTP